MPLTIPSELMMNPFSKLKTGVNGRIIISRTFQKTLGELAMSRFITYAGGSSSESDLADQMWEALIKAYIYFVGLPFILNYAGKAISINKNLRPYFEQWPMAKTYFAARERYHWNQVKNGSWSAWRDMILSKTGYSATLYDEFNPRASLLNVERYKGARMLEIQDEGKLTDPQLCQVSGQYLKDTTDPSVFFMMQAESVPLVSVFIGMDVIIILSNIQLMLIYRSAIKNKAASIDIPAWLKYQSARIQADTGYSEKQYFDDYGKLTLNIPTAPTKPSKVDIDTYGLKLSLYFTYPPPFTQLFTESWGVVIPPPPVFELVFTEPWGVATPEPPDMTVVMFEPWNVEIPEPPDMTQLMLEPWSVEAPEMVLIFIEHWGTLIPEFTQRMIEHWTS